MFVFDERKSSSNHLQSNSESKWRKDDEEWIKEAIDQLANSSWYKTEAGKAVVDKLRVLFAEEKIHFSNLEVGTDGEYNKILNTITITNREYGYQVLATILAHEGTHAVQWEHGLGMFWNYALYIEKDASINENASGIAIKNMLIGGKTFAARCYTNWTPNMPSDSEIKELYSEKLDYAKSWQKILYGHPVPETAPFDYYK